MRILVTDGDERASLAAVRSLGRAGHVPFVVDADDGGSLAGASRFADERRTVPDPNIEPGAYLDALARAAADWGVDMVVPISEASLHAVLPARDRFPGATIPFPDHDVFDLICDKPHVMRTARDLGIPVPDQVELGDRDAAGRAEEALAFPIVLKPARSVVAGSDGRERTSVVHVADPGELSTALADVPDAAYPVLAQERIRGPGAGVFVLLWDGELRAGFAHERLLEKPPSGGVSVLRKSVRLDPELLQMSRRLLEALDWTGVAMVEYKRDRETGTPYLMEINGRFWGSLQLAVDAGVDFPRLLVEAAAGGEGAGGPVTDYEEDVRLQWFWGRVDHEYLAVRSARERGGAAAGIARALRGLGPFLRDLTVRQEVFRFDDPGPFLHESVSWFRRAGS